LLNKRAQKKLEAIREELEAEGWKWLEINPERDWNFINRCHRIQPQLIDVPSDLIDLKTQLDAELAEIEQSLEDSESDELIERQRVVQERLEQAETQLVPFVGFPEEQKLLAGCCVSIGQDGMPFIDKGLVRPEERKQWANLLGTGEGGTPAKPKGSLPESLRRDLAAERLQVARVEMAKHPLIVLDLLIYQIAVSMLDQPFANDGAEMQFKRPKTSGETESTIAGEAFDTMAKTLSVGWLKEPSDSARFAAFRSLDETAKLDLLAYSVALTLKPKLAPAAFEESTAYDLALSLTGASVAGYWRPTKANLLSRLGREQLLVISRDVMGDAWAQAHSSDKKALLVDQLDRAFANPEKYGRTPGQLQMLKSWLPTGMSFQHPSSPQSTQSGKTKQAA
jgi:ParB family chromosome partitioning protein